VASHRLAVVVGTMQKAAAGAGALAGALAGKKAGLAPPKAGMDSTAASRGTVLLKAKAQGAIVWERFRKMAEQSGALEVFAGSPVAELFERDPGWRREGTVRDAVQYWLQTLFVSGAELSPELSVEPELLEAVFQRAQMVSCHKGMRLQEEGAEVRCYTVVLSGRCRLRCRVPATKNSGTGKGEAVEEEDDRDAADGATPVAAEPESAAHSDSFATCQVVGRGESFGLAPGEFPSGYDVVAVDKSTVLLQLSAEDYAATLRDHHLSLQAEALEFLRRHNVCPHANPQQLKRLAACMRHRTLRRGALALRAGEPQRQVWLLRSGAVSVQVRGEQEATSGGEGAGAERGPEGPSGEEERAEALREARRRMRGLSGDRKLNVAAYDRKAHLRVAKYARGALRASLQGEGRAASCGPPGAPRSGLVAAARVQEPGAMVGEEVLLHKHFRDMVAQCYCYTVQAVEDSSFYVLDLTTFRQLLTCVGLDARTVEARLHRKLEHRERAARVGKQLVREARELQSFEAQKQERQKLRLPTCVGYAGAEELGDLDDWLEVVMEHRKKPPDMLNPMTLTCLEAIGRSPATRSPGIDAMLRVFSDSGALKEYRCSQSAGQLRRRAAVGRAPNPMGEVVAPAARYEEAAPPSSQGGGALLALADGAPAAAALEEAPASGGIFFQTEPELDDDQAVAAMASPVQAAAPPVAGRGRPSVGDVANSRSASVASLPQIRQGSAGSAGGRRPLSKASSAAGLGPAGRRGAPAEDDEAPPKDAEARKAKERLRHVTRAFAKAIPGKSILVFTDQKAVQRSIAGALTSGTEVDLCWVKSTIELWQRLYEPKEHAALLLDLSKSELDVGSLLSTVKQHSRYSRLPIIVLSADRELPEVVRMNCSFVVFLPLSAATLRESLLWCFDRQTVQQHCNYDWSYAAPQPGATDPAGRDSRAGAATTALSFQPMGMVKGTKVA